jgi:hypothetical protein
MVFGWNYLFEQAKIERQKGAETEVKTNTNILVQCWQVFRSAISTDEVSDHILAVHSSFALYLNVRYITNSKALLSAGKLPNVYAL